VFSIIILSFQKEDNVGKAIFENKCKSCHLPNKATQIAPSFQDIRKDYGLKWTLAFIKDSRKLREQGDIKTLYAYYLFDKIKHTNFPALEPKYVIKILDYVDSFPTDTLAFKHRHVSYSDKKRFVELHKAKDTIAERQDIINLDTLVQTTEDTLNSNTQGVRQSSRRGNPKKQN
jgi:hypothetical protein